MSSNQGKNLPSLIAIDERQPVLFSEFGEAGEQAEKSLSQAREHTGANLYSSDPDKYRLVVELLGRGMSQRIIANACRVSVNTVRAVAVREGERVDTLKECISLNLKRFAALAVERLLDEGHDIPLNQLAVAMGIAIDKAQLLDGEPTTITAAAGKTVSDYADAIDALPSAKGRVIEEGEDLTGFAGEDVGQRGIEVDRHPSDQARTDEDDETGTDDSTGD